MAGGTTAGRTRRGTVAGGGGDNRLARWVPGAGATTRVSEFHAGRGRTRRPDSPSITTAAVPASPAPKSATPPVPSTSLPLLRAPMAETASDGGRPVPEWAGNFDAEVFEPAARAAAILAFRGLAGRKACSRANGALVRTGREAAPARTSVPVPGVRGASISVPRGADVEL